MGIPTGSLTNDDLAAIRLAAGKCSLDSSPKRNWVENRGGLPQAICEMAKALIRDGHSKERAIAIAISRAKKLAVAPGSDADTRAKYAKAVGEWESMKARQAASKVKASNVLQMSTVSYPVDIISAAFEESQRRYRLLYRAKHLTALESDIPHMALLELWNDHVIASDGYGSGARMYRIDYSVDPSRKVSFGEPIEVIRQYVTPEQLNDRPDGDEAMEMSARLDNPLLALAAKSVSESSRDRWAKAGVALKDGSYPIPNVDYLKRAIQSFGRANPADRDRVKAHIKRRAATLGQSDLIPKEW